MSKDTGAVHPIEAFDPEGERADFGGGLVLVCVLAGSLFKLYCGVCVHICGLCVCVWEGVAAVCVWCICGL